MFCSNHPIPQEDCAACEPTLVSMRPTVFAELAAAELRNGTDCCAVCEYLYFGKPTVCPRCNSPVASGAVDRRSAPRPPALRHTPASWPVRAHAAPPAYAFAQPGLSAARAPREPIEA